MKIRLVRHATLLLNIKNKRILVDPMLSPAGTIEAIPNVCNTNKNPLVKLPIDLHKIVNVDAILLTHMHRDHFDEFAAQLIPKHTPVFCQPEDKKKVESKGFFTVIPIEQLYIWEGIKINRTGGQHGTGKIGKEMGAVSGYVITAQNEPSLYIAGDTILCSEVEGVLKTYKPQITVVFAGAARFSEGDAITMTEEDIYNLCRKAPYTKVVAVHMEAWNHCTLTKLKLKEFLEKHALNRQVYVPNDGEYRAY
ncbi:MBL fold metallo-hydrolase [Clostridium sp. DJ247]|uniref:MBL fold metallo-hydrolase n=1 Tax=Clostridium sp. DJ247 TaxID=2726188 RepID=UPI0016254D6B|nr:MBL fold metallo-hydrolase [Clostridium sp. DJ247]MBC2578832.1 MBL fold metallo-hydrolase [Clostridium sp. DJ247]